MVNPVAEFVTTQATSLQGLAITLSNWVTTIAHRANQLFPKDGTESMDAAIPLKSFTVGTLPVSTATHLIFVSDETGGATLAFADGSNWRRVQDRNIVS